MPSRKHLPTRALRDKPDLAQLKRQAKELLQAFVARDAVATAEITAHYHGADPARFALHDAQLVLARSYGFESWPKLKAFVDGVTVRGLCDAVRAGDIDGVRAMLTVRPELVHLDVAEDDEHRALHHAVLQRQPEIVRLLMQHGADARKGIWPHRDATSPLTMAIERGYADIVAIIRDDERRHSQGSAGAADAAATRDVRDSSGHAKEAIRRGDADWLRARKLDDSLGNERRLVTHAVTSGRTDMLALLLDLGLDPDERERVDGLEEVVYSWGEPLRQCALSSQTGMAELLLTRGASANTNVYAASSALFNAHQRNDDAMIALLERHGARLDPCAVGLLGLTDHAARLLAEASPDRAPDELTSPEASVAQGLLWAAIESPSPDIVRMALAHINWPRDDARWYSILQNGLYPSVESNRAAHVEGLRLVLERSDPNLRSKRGATLLHYLAAAHGDRTPNDRMTFASMLLDAGARLDLRDDVLQSTPLGWACRWGRVELVTLFLERGADPLEAGAEPWATPMAWAEKMNRRAVLSVLRTSVLDVPRADLQARPSRE